MSVIKYRKKPVIIDAIQLTSESLMDCIGFLYPDISAVDHPTLIAIRKNKFLYIETLEGDMKAQFGDYIIKGVHGEFYPCKPDIFELTYEVIK